MKSTEISVIGSVTAALLFVSGCSKQEAKLESKTPPAATKAITGSPAFSELAVSPKPNVTPELLAQGKRLYTQNCVACHGEKGDGKGAAAAFLAPKPRDFVGANYRLRSTALGKLPTDVDLFREISLGMPGTPMPPWKHMLSNDERWALVEYLKTFSPRFADSTEERVALTDFGTPPAKNAVTIAQGKDLYTKFNCINCHGDGGHGNGAGAAALVDDSGTPIKPRDFGNPNTFKGGFASKEIVRTILTGLNGTPMIGFSGSISNQDAWALAYYVETFARPSLPLLSMVTTSGSVPTTGCTVS